MFGFAKFTPEELAERERKARIAELNVLLVKETASRNASLVRSEAWRDELEAILKG